MVSSDMKVVPYLDQKYESLKAEAKSSGKLFVDPKFPAEDKSIYQSKPVPDGIVWKRPGVSLLVHGKALALSHHALFVIVFTERPSNTGYIIIINLKLTSQFSHHTKAAHHFLLYAN